MIRLYFCLMILFAAHICAFEESHDKVIRQKEGNTVIFADQKLLAYWNKDTDTYSAFDTTDKAFLVVLNDPKDIYNQIKDKYYQLNNSEAYHRRKRQKIN